MPYSFTKIEEDKSKIIGAVFSALVFFYFFSAWLVYLVAKNFIVFQYARASRENPAFVFVNLRESAIILGVALVAGALHWFVTTRHIIPRILDMLKAQPCNTKDNYHRMFYNIIGEVSTATGGRKIEGVVVPIMAMNAFALADFSGRAIIGVTEGLLSRLSRAQIEAVVGHEAAHIITGDSVVKTVVSSLFDIYGDILQKAKEMIMYTARVRSRTCGPMVFLAVIYVALFVTETMSKIMRMFVSRQRELRADAIAVRLTRDPLSLAEALYTVSHRWRGAGVSGEKMEALFIINPKFSPLDEKKGLSSDLFATHPPIKQRLDVLLNMAHSDAKLIEEEFVRKDNRPRKQAPEHLKNAPLPAQQNQWMINHDGNWEGPIEITQMMTLGWIRPDTWIKRIGGERVLRACDDSEINKMFRAKENNCEISEGMCPKCRVSLIEEIYEGVPLLRCNHCGGILTKEVDVQKILIRREYGFSDRVKELAEYIKKQPKNPYKSGNLKGANLLSCPNCSARNAKMIRMFYTVAYPVEIDKCIFCNSIWFDKDELEILQYLLEERVK